MPRLVSTDPATGEELGSVEVAGPAQVREALETARAAQEAWAERPLADRLAVIEAFQDRLLGARRAIAVEISREAGKPVAEALAADVLPSLEMAQFLVREAARVLRPETRRLSNPLLLDRHSQFLREPVGAVGLIAPWNYPLGIPATNILAALAAGNGVVLKPSEHTPLIAGSLVALLQEAGVPEELVQVVHGKGPTGAALVEAAPDLVLFTGSVATGRTVATACAERFVPVVLELGGKDPMLVLDDANLELAARGAAWGKFTNAGQTCAAVERLYVHEAVAERFLELLVEEVRRIRVGRGQDEGVDMGPLIDEAAVDRVAAHVADATKRGAQIASGGTPLAELGPRFFAPTVLTDCNHEMLVMREETFGPVLPVQVVSSDDKAVTLANDSTYGLTASVWTRERRRGEALAALLEAGTVTINDAVYTYAACETPWLGVKHSGLGHTHGRWGLEAMTRLKHVNVARGGRARSPWYFPYDEDLARLVDDGLEFLYGSKTAGVRVVGAFKRRFF